MSHVVMETCLFLYFPQCFVSFIYSFISAATFICGRFGIWMHSAGFFFSSRLSRHDSEWRKRKTEQRSTNQSTFFFFLKNFKYLTVSNRNKRPVTGVSHKSALVLNASQELERLKPREMIHGELKDVSGGFLSG